MEDNNLNKIFGDANLYDLEKTETIIDNELTNLKIINKDNNEILPKIIKCIQLLDNIEASVMRKCDNNYDEMMEMISMQKLNENIFKQICILHKI